MKLDFELEIRVKGENQNGLIHFDLYACLMEYQA